jgi:hypothetical protein
MGNVPWSQSTHQKAVRRSSHSDGQPYEIVGRSATSLSWSELQVSFVDLYGPEGGLAVRDINQGVD